jgi:hypothetical protein
LVSFERVYSLLYQRCIFLFLVCIINVLFGGTKRVKQTIINIVEMTSNMYWFVPLLYSIYWLLHVSAVACHRQGASYMLCVTFWVVLRRMVFNSRRFGTLCLFHLHRRVDASAIKHHTPENNPNGYTRHTEQPKRLHTTYRTTQKVTHDIQKKPKRYTWHTEQPKTLHATYRTT